MSAYKGFDSVKLTRPQRSLFDLSHEVRLSTRMGKLTPIFVSEVMPNDTFFGSSEIYLKLAPMMAPVMHRINLYVHFFYVPNRLLWEQWENFITNGRLGTSSPPVPPNFSIPTALNLGTSVLAHRSLFDYLGGYPIVDADVASWPNRTLDMMPFAAYYKIWYDYYRDRNFVDDNQTLPMASGLIDVQSISQYSDFLKIKYRCWEHDYYTSALPFTQRGTEVLMPIVAGVDWTYKSPTVVSYSATGLPPVNTSGLNHTAAEIRDDLNAGLVVDNIADITVDSSQVSINDLRRAVRLQEWLERNALAGSRYTESIRAHFGRVSSDARLQRAEYLGGGKAIVQVGEIMTTSYSEDSDSALVPPGNPTGKAQSYSNTNKFTYNAEEHGFIIGILSVMPTSGYMQGIDRMFYARNSFLDYPWPTFAHLGEQPVYKYELYATPSNLPVTRGDAAVFGYQSRYADWKHKGSAARGDFRTSLEYWHLTRRFSSNPVLGEIFNTFEDALQDRIFNVSGIDTVWLYVHNNIKVKRSLPYFGTPNL